MNIYTPPDCNLQSDLPRIWLYNCNWTDEQILEAFEQTPHHKDFDVYLYNSAMNDVQWEEGMKNRCVKRYNCDDYPDLDHLQLAMRIYNEF